MIRRPLAAALAAIGALLAAPLAQAQSYGAPGPATPPSLNSPATTTLALGNGDCGGMVSAASAGGTLSVTLPATPPANCIIGFIPQTNAIVLNPNGNTINVSGTLYATGYTLALIASGSGRNASNPTRLGWDGSVWSFRGGWAAELEYSALGSGVVDQLAAHGQVRLSLTGTTLQLCPFNGLGGLIVNHGMRIVPPCNGSTSFGAQLPNTGTTGSSVLNYIYARAISAAITAADNTGCNGRLTVGNESAMAVNDSVDIFGLTNTTEANGHFTIASLPDSTHICLTGITFTHTGADAGSVSGLGLTASATGHVTDTASVTSGAVDNVEVMSGDGTRTLVGIVWVGAAQLLSDSATKRDVLSWYNRRPKKLLVQDTNARTFAAGTAGTFKTPSAVIEAEFVSAAAQTLPGSDPVPAVDWRISANVGQTANDACAIGAAFTTAAQSAAATVTAEPEFSEVQPGVSANLSSLFVGGTTTTLTEGRNFMDMAGFAVTATCTLSSQSPGVAMEAVIQQ